jgi:hypothetical protein
MRIPKLETFLASLVAVYGISAGTKIGIQKNTVVTRIKSDVAKLALQFLDPMFMRRALNRNNRTVGPSDNRLAEPAIAEVHRSRHLVRSAGPNGDRLDHHTVDDSVKVTATLSISATELSSPTNPTIEEMTPQMTDGGILREFLSNFRLLAFAFVIWLSVLFAAVDWPVIIIFLKSFLLVYGVVFVGYAILCRLRRTS